MPANCGALRLKGRLGAELGRWSSTTMSTWACRFWPEWPRNGPSDIKQSVIGFSVRTICFPISRPDQRQSGRRPQLSPFEANFINFGSGFGGLGPHARPKRRACPQLSVSAGFGRHPHWRECGAPRASAPFAGFLSVGHFAAHERKFSRHFKRIFWEAYREFESPLVRQ